MVVVVLDFVNVVDYIVVVVYFAVNHPCLVVALSIYIMIQLLRCQDLVSNFVGRCSKSTQKCRERSKSSEKYTRTCWCLKGSILFFAPSCGWRRVAFRGRPGVILGRGQDASFRRRRVPICVRCPLLIV